jgi:hypothetical protein
MGMPTEYVPKAEALAKLAVWSRELSAADEDASVVNAAIDAVESMSEEAWAAKLGEL